MTINILRWTARIAGGIILLIWTFLFFADLFGINGHKESNPFDIKSFWYLTLMAVSVLGLALSWIWELAGGIITLASFLINIVINPKILMILPHYALPVLAILFIISWGISRKERQNRL